MKKIVLVLLCALGGVNAAEHHPYKPHFVPARVSSDLIQWSHTLRDALDKEVTEAMDIPLPMFLTSDVIAHIEFLIRFLKRAGNTPRDTLEKIDIEALRAAVHKETAGDPAKTIKLLRAVNYLAIEPLVEVIARDIAAHIHDYGLKVQQDTDEQGNVLLDNQGKPYHKLVSTKFNEWNELPLELVTSIVFYVGKHFGIVIPYNFEPQDKALLSGQRGRGISGIAFSPDSRLVAIASYDGTVQVVDIATKAKLHVLLAHEVPEQQGSVDSISWSPDGKFIAITAHFFVGEHASGKVKIFAADTGDVVHEWLAEEGLMRAIAWSPDSKIVATGSDTGMLRLWSIDPAQPARFLEGFLVISALAWQGQYLAIAHGTTVTLLDTVHSENALIECTLSEIIQCLVWRPNSPLLAIGGRGLFILDTVQNLQHTIGAWTLSDLAWSPEGRYLVLGFFNGDIQIMEPDSNLQNSRHRKFTDLRGMQTRVAWSSDGCYIAAGSGAGLWRLWQVRPQYNIRYIHDEWNTIMPAIMQQALAHTNQESMSSSSSSTSMQH